MEKRNKAVCGAEAAPNSVRAVLCRKWGLKVTQDQAPCLYPELRASPHMHKIIQIVVLCFSPNAPGCSFIRSSMSREVEDKDPLGQNQNL